MIGCSNIDVEIHYVKKLGRRIILDGKIIVLTSNNKRLSGIGAILSAINNKQIPLCSFHHLEFEIGNYSALNKSFFKTIYNVDCSGLNFEKTFKGK